MATAKRTRKPATVAPTPVGRTIAELFSLAAETYAGHGFLGHAATVRVWDAATSAERSALGRWLVANGFPGYRFGDRDHFATFAAHCALGTPLDYRHFLAADAT